MTSPQLYVYGPPHCYCYCCCFVMYLYLHPCSFSFQHAIYVKGFDAHSLNNINVYTSGRQVVQEGGAVVAPLRVCPRRRKRCLLRIRSRSRDRERREVPLEGCGRTDAHALLVVWYEENFYNAPFFFVFLPNRHGNVVVVVVVIVIVQIKAQVDGRCCREYDRCLANGSRHASFPPRFGCISIDHTTGFGGNDPCRHLPLLVRTRQVAYSYPRVKRNPNRSLLV